MDNAIYQLVKNLRRIGPNKLTLEEKLIQLWQMAVNEWNTTHEPTFLTLEEVHRAFKNKWPQIGGGEPSNDTLHLSFGYIDYTFTHNSKGQVCGGIWPKIEQKPEFPVNMTAEQIVDLACFLRREPISLKKWEENEVYISSLDRSEMEKRCQKMYYGDNKENCYYTRLQNAGISQCGIGLFEDSFISLSRSMICRLRYQHDRQSIIYCSPNVWDDLVQASLYTIMAEDLAHMYLWDEAEWCFMLAYEHRLDIFEKMGWRRKYAADLDGGRADCAYSYYTDWVEGVADYLIMSHRHPKALIKKLKKAKTVFGCLPVYLESIINISKSQKSHE